MILRLQALSRTILTQAPIGIDTIQGIQSQADTRNLISDFWRQMDFVGVYTEVINYYQSETLLKNMTSLSFLNDSLMTNAIGVVIAVSVLLVSLFTLYNYIKSFKEDYSENQDLFWKVISTTFLIVMFPSIFGVIDSLSTSLIDGASTISVEGQNTVGLFQTSPQLSGIFSEPNFIDYDPSKPTTTTNDKGQTKFDINEICTQTTEKGCVAPINGMDIVGWKVGQVHTYRYQFDAQKMKWQLQFFMFCNWIIIFQVVNRAFKVALGYLLNPLAQAFKLTKLEPIAERISADLYTDVFCLGIQLTVMRLVSVFSFQLIPNIFPDGTKGLGGFIVSVVSFFIIIGTPSWVKRMASANDLQMGKLPFLNKIKGWF